MPPWGDRRDSNPVEEGHNLLPRPLRHRPQWWAWKESNLHLLLRREGSFPLNDKPVDPADAGVVRWCARRESNPHGQLRRLVPCPLGDERRMQPPLGGCAAAWGAARTTSCRGMRRSCPEGADPRRGRTKKPREPFGARGSMRVSRGDGPYMEPLGGLMRASTQPGCCAVRFVAASMAWWCIMVVKGSRPEMAGSVATFRRERVGPPEWIDTRSLAQQPNGASTFFKISRGVVRHR